MAEQRASKKQREVLEYIDTFIKDNGFGPSYREVMRALNYKSVSTVAAHVDELIARGFLQKRDNSARSLHVLSTAVETGSKEAMQHHIEWLRGEVVKRESDPDRLKEAAVLKEALALLDQSVEK